MSTKNLPVCPIIDLQSLPDGNVQITLDGAFLRESIELFGSTLIAFDITERHEIFEKLVKSLIGSNFNPAISQIKYEQVQEQLNKLDKILMKSDEKEALKLIIEICRENGFESLTLEPLNTYFEGLIEEIKSGNLTREKNFNKIMKAVLKERRNLFWSVQDYQKLREFCDTETVISTRIFDLMIELCSECPDRKTYGSRYQCNQYESKKDCAKLIEHIKVNHQHLSKQKIKSVLNYENSSTYLRETLRINFKIPKTKQASEICTHLKNTH